MRPIATVAVLLLPMLALALPMPGTSLPPVQGKDLDGQPRELLKLIHPNGSLIVAITDRNASNEMRAWFAEADARKVPAPGRISILSLRLPFFVSDGQARDKAKKEVPQQFWSKTLMDKDGKMAEQLGIGIGNVAWAFVVAPGGKILATAHGRPDGPEAKAIWSALETGRVQRGEGQKGPTEGAPERGAPMPSGQEPTPGKQEPGQAPLQREQGPEQAPTQRKQGPGPVQAPLQRKQGPGQEPLQREQVPE